MNDVVINKIQSIQRCVRRAREEYRKDPEGFAGNYTRQDAAMLNVVRACETAIDLANHVIRVRKLGIPVSSADTFELLKAERVIDPVPGGSDEENSWFPQHGGSPVHEDRSGHRRGRHRHRPR
jgi:hypothetical protein